MSYAILNQYKILTMDENTVTSTTPSAFSLIPEEQDAIVYNQNP